MATASKRRSALVVLLFVVLAAATIAFVKRDAIADRLLRGGDTTLTGDAARNSEQAEVALAFLGGYLTLDLEAIGRVAAPDYLAALRAEKEQPTPEFEQMRAAVLEDLLADPATVRERIKTVQVHGDRAVVLAETPANSWFVQLAGAPGRWKVIGF